MPSLLCSEMCIRERHAAKQAPVHLAWLSSGHAASAESSRPPALDVMSLNAQSSVLTAQFAALQAAPKSASHAQCSTLGNHCLAQPSLLLLTNSSSLQYLQTQALWFSTVYGNSGNRGSCRAMQRHKLSKLLVMQVYLKSVRPSSVPIGLQHVTH